MPLLPTTKVYVSPPLQRTAGLAGGHELAQTGSGLSDLVIVRSTPGFTVLVRFVEVL